VQGRVQLLCLQDLNDTLHARQVGHNVGPADCLTGEHGEHAQGQLGEGGVGEQLRKSPGPSAHAQDIEASHGDEEAASLGERGLGRGQTLEQRPEHRGERGRRPGTREEPLPLIGPRA